MPDKRSKLKYSDFAKNDLNETWSYIAEQAPDFADEVVEGLHQVSLLIAQNPLIGVAKDYLLFGLRMFPHNNYNIYYLISDTGVEVYRVLHSSRNAVQIFEDKLDQPN